jgi:type IV secretion system protein VirD4
MLPDGKLDSDSANAGLRREPGLERHKDIAPESAKHPMNEFEPDREENDDDAVRRRAVIRSMRQVARQAAMDPRDGIEL